MGTPSFDLKFDLEDDLKNVFYVNFWNQRVLLDPMTSFQRILNPTLNPSLNTSLSSRTSWRRHPHAVTRTAWATVRSVAVSRGTLRALPRLERTQSSVS